MNLIVLAAGAGTRLGGRAKGLIGAGDGRPLMYHAAKNLMNHITQITVITGCYHDEYSHVYNDLGISTRFVLNPFWAISGNLSSVWLALEVTPPSEPFIICNSDVVTSKEYCDKLVAHAEENGAASALLQSGDITNRKIYAGMSVVVAQKEMRIVRARVSELMQMTEENEELRRHLGHWDVFCRPLPTPAYNPNSTNTVIAMFRENQTVRIPDDHRIEIDDLEDLIEFYRGRLAGRWGMMF